MPVRLPIRISTIDAETDPESGEAYFRTCEETCLDISRGGAFVTTHEPVVPGRRLLVELELPGGAVVETIGRVAWSRIRLGSPQPETAPGMGVEFLGGPSEDLAQLDRYLSRIARQRDASPGNRLASATPGLGG